MKAKLNIQILFIVTLVVLLLPSAVYAGSADKEIRLGLHDSGWPPYIVHEKDGKAYGIMIDVMKAVAEKHSYTLKILPLPEKRAVKGIESGHIDAYPKAREWVADPDIHLWTDPVVVSTDVLVFPKDQPLRFVKADDLAGKNIGAVLGYRYPLLEPHFADGRIQRNIVKNEKMLLRKLLRKRDDAAILNRHVALWMIRQEPKFQGVFAFSETPIGEAGYRFMLTSKRNWGPFIEIFNEELAAMKTDGRLSLILKKYQ